MSLRLDFKPPLVNLNRKEFNVYIPYRVGLDLQGANARVVTGAPFIKMHSALRVPSSKTAVAQQWRDR